MAHLTPVPSFEHAEQRISHLGTDLKATIPSTTGTSTLTLGRLCTTIGIDGIRRRCRTGLCFPIPQTTIIDARIFLTVIVRTKIDWFRKTARCELVPITTPVNAKVLSSIKGTVISWYIAWNHTWNR